MVDRGINNIPITLAGSTGTTTVNRVACNTTHNVGSFVIVALNANIKDNVMVNNGLICKRSKFTNRLNRIVVHHGGKHPYNYNHRNYLRTCTSTAKITHATHRFLRVHGSSDLLHRLSPSRVASGSICSTTVGGSGLTLRVFRFANGVLNRTFTSFITFSDPRTVVLFKNLAGTKSLVVGPVGHSVRGGVLGIFRNGAGLLFSRLGRDSTTMLNTDTLN